MNEEIRFIDLFSGIGGFRLGLERTNSGVGKQRRQDICIPRRQEAIDGSRTRLSQEEQHSRYARNSSYPKGIFRCVWSNDFNKYANQVYTERFGGENHITGDIRGIDPKDIPNHDLICAGFPCQAFSVAGKRKGFKDTRGTLFFEICRIAEHHRPSLLLLENVKGLLSHDGGRTFGTILESLEELGYWWEYQVLNSKHFGVPQNRERVFIIGHLRTGSTRPIFPILKTSGVIDERDSEKQVASTLQSPGHAAGNYRGMNMIQEPFIKNLPHGYNDGFEKPLPSLKSNSGSQYNELVVLPVLTPDRPKKRQHGRRFKEPGEPMFTLTGQDRHGIMEISSCLDTSGYLYDGRRNRDEEGKTVPTSMCEKRIRRLTPTECERLQGFPDGWTEGVSDTQRYKCLGNAVTVNVIEFLGHKLKECFIA